MARTLTATVELADRDHLDGCPARPERIETYTATQPGGRQVKVTRCIDCGGQLVRSLGASSSTVPTTVDQGDDA